MGDVKVERTSFNRGLISPLALARVDVKRVGLASELQTNWIPRTLGPMSLRPGLQYLANTLSNLVARYVPFVFRNNDTALLEFTDLKMRVLVNEIPLTRSTVTTTVANGTFTTDLTGWTDADEGTTPTSVWLTGGYMSLLGDGTNSALRTQTLTVATNSLNIEHALRVVVTQGNLIFRVGSTAGGDEYISEATLVPGEHSLAFTPTTTSVFIQLSARDTYATLVDSCTLEAAGVVWLPTPIRSADLGLVRHTQSADVVFAAANDRQNFRVERRAVRSWSVVNFVSEDGPFRVQNLSPTTLTPTAITGTITLTASKPVFRATNVGSIYQLISTGQTVTRSLGAADVYSDPVLVTGLTVNRGVNVTVTGTWVATLTLQRSVGTVGNWVDVETYTTNQSKVYNDALDNQSIYYRIGIKAGNYTSGTASATLSYAFGSITGSAKITAYTSSTVVTAVVVRNLGATAATRDWAEGAWSTRRGFPSAVTLHEGRLWWAGRDKIWASVSDNFISHDANFEGDAGPINRSIGEGSVDVIAWLLSSPRLLVGAQDAEKSVRSSALDEPITPTNFNIKDTSTYGSAEIAGLKIDTSVIFVDRTGSRVMESLVDTGLSRIETTDLTTIVPEVCEPYVTYTAIQRRPDTRVHCVLSDGTVALLVYDRAEDVKCWVKVTTNGLIENVVVLPGEAGSIEDKVYYVVARTINGATVRYVEKWAKASECIGGTVNRQADAFYYWTGASSTMISGLTHLVGASVVCWAAGKDQGTFTVSSAGVITLPEAVTSAVVGLVYTANYRSTKLAYADRTGASLTVTKRVDNLGLVLANTHYQGLKFGVDADHLDDLPLVENGETTAADTVWEAYDKDSVPVDGAFDTDTRLYLRATAPRPCTVLAAVIAM